MKIRSGALIGALIFVAIQELIAHPVAFKGANQWRFDFSDSMQSAELYHSYTADKAFGMRYLRFDDHSTEDSFLGVQHNWLLHRWNLPDAQANLYAGIGFGAAQSESHDWSPGGLSFLQADWETRRWYAAWNSTVLYAQEFTHWRNVSAVGVAPYKAEYDQLNTWFLFKAEHTTEFHDNEIQFIPTLRLFKKNIFVEAGVSFEGELRLSFMIHF
ncbi:MAG: hypothetical protein AAGJ79_05295 [Verrucomicrobiota bacterium]